MPPRSRARSSGDGRALASGTPAGERSHEPGTCPLSRHGVLAQPLGGTRARRVDADARRGRARSVAVVVAIRSCAAVMRRHVQPDVDAVEERPAEPAEVAPPRERRARALGVPRAEVAARARVRGEHELEPRREARRPARPRDGDRRPDSSGWRRASSAAGLNSGASSRKSTPCAARAAAPGRMSPLPPPTIAAGAGGVVRRLERRPARRSSAPTGMPDQRADRTHLEAGDGIEVGQQRREPRGEHRLAGAGRPEQVDVVPAGRGDLHGLHRIRVADDVGEVARFVGRRPRARPASAGPTGSGVEFGAVEDRRVARAT